MQDPAGIFELIEVVGNGTYGQVYKVLGRIWDYMGIQTSPYYGQAPFADQLYAAVFTCSCVTIKLSFFACVQRTCRSSSNILYVTDPYTVHVVQCCSTLTLLAVLMSTQCLLMTVVDCICNYCLFMEIVEWATGRVLVTSLFSNQSLSSQANILRYI